MTDNAVLLLNLGTPSANSQKAVRAYLREFLLDHRVIQLPWLLRWLLVTFIIAPFRSKKSAQAYKAIWTTEGSPLIVNSRNLQKNLQIKLNNTTQGVNQNTNANYDVWLAMRYGEPNLSDILDKIQKKTYTRITIVPLYPQYASASTGSALEKSLKYLSDFRYFPKICCINEFFYLPGYIKSVAKQITQTIAHNNSLRNSKYHILFSYHGIPENQMQLIDPKKKPYCSENCENGGSCPKRDYPKTCYRAQCYATTNMIAAELNLTEEQFTTCFQSRLGRTRWIEPYINNTIQKLLDQNIRNLVVVCPSFVADCLETLEEIGIRLKQEWLRNGGTSFTLIPSLNDDDMWVDTLANIIIKEQ
jgi:ferrochelatase